MKRRKFIKHSSLGAAVLVSAFHIPGFSQERKIKVGLIGCGWYGGVITKAAFNVGGVEVTAICDVDTDHLKNMAEELEKLQGSRPATYADYRELLDHPGLESIFLATPPHWHALQFIAACEKGYDIYCEKPLAYDVKEGLAMIDAAGKAGNIVQVGFQRRQSKAFKKAKELINDGTAGTVHQIAAQIHYVPNLKDTTIQPPPESLDWDAWCGPAPKLPYRPNIGHFAWRLEKEYGNGHLVDWGIHHIDIIRQIMDLGMPVSFQSEGGLRTLEGKITTPDTLTARMEFEKSPLIWEHRMWGTGELNPQYNNGVFFYGDKATIFAADRRIVIMPAGKDQEQQVMDITPGSMADQHMADFLNAVRKKDKNLLSCTVQDAFQSTATVQLAMISHYTDSRIEWDMDRKTIPGNREAAGMLDRKYRKGYERPKI